MKPNIVIVDDDPNALFGISQTLKDEGYDVFSFNNALEALQFYKNNTVDLVITDEKMPDMSGMEVLTEIQQSEQKSPVILITAYGSVTLAVQALKRGAFYFFEKPVFNNLDQFLAIVRQALKTQDMARELVFLRQEVRDRYSFPNIVGGHPLMKALFEVISRVAPTNKSVLIEGESGTGKDLIARTLHFNSLRKEEPLISVNCGALTDTLFTSELFGHSKGAFTGAVKDHIGRFQAAERGTLVLEEIGEIPYHLQRTLLRVLEEKEYERVGSNKPIRMDARIIATTNRNLKEEVVKGNFREDLYYRISVVPLMIPPLRERMSDIPLLLDHFLKKFGEVGETIQLETGALRRLCEHSWPGNVRELANVVQRMIVFCRQGKITTEDLPPQILSPDVKDPLQATGRINLIRLVSEMERKWIRLKLKESDGNQEKAARLLGLTRKMLMNRITKYNIKPSRRPESPDARRVRRKD
ncbi:MAG: sigma-54-dependent Fis family transcriptional regulator [Deltaproteobacteria bacterium]|nr:sigma-54-dependent Fis family transcriptional regulator [Deltaproteobacteria bacterium]